MARRSRLHFSGRRPFLYLAIVGIVVLVTLAVALGLILSSGTSRTPSPIPSAARLSTAELIQAAVRHHDFTKPECIPVSGPRWMFPGPSHITSTLYESFAIKYSCQLAATWEKRLVRLTVPVSKTGSLVPLKIAPRGYSCGAWPDGHGHAYAGGCADPTIHSSFGWNWNVANPRVVYEYNAQNKLQRVKVGGADSITTLIPQQNDHFKIIVLNTSGVGYITTFRWIPPNGWTIKAITNATGASCHVASDHVLCSGQVDPPNCLCGGDGGRVVVEMIIKAPSQGTVDGHPVYYGNEGEETDLTSMAPVPFLIPGTHSAAARQRKSE